MSIDHIIKGYEIQSCRGNLKRLIASTSLNYGYQFMGSLYIVDSRS